jgi:hypothetical protein
MTIFRLVGGTDVQPSAAPTTPLRRGLADNPRDEPPSTETLSTTAKNGRLREKRKEIWAPGRGGDTVLERAIGFRPCGFDRSDAGNTRGALSSYC